MKASLSPKERKELLQTVEACEEYVRLLEEPLLRSEHKGDPLAIEIETLSKLQKAEDEFEDLNPENSKAILAFRMNVGLLEAVDDLSKESSEDADARLGEALLALARIKDVLRQFKHFIDTDSLRDTDIAKARIKEVLPNMEDDDLERLLDSDGTEEIDDNRLYLVSRLATRLQYSFTEKGVLMWFDNPRHQLENNTPLEYMNASENDPEVLLDLVGE